MVVKKKIKAKKKAIIKSEDKTALFTYMVDGKAVTVPVNKGIEKVIQQVYMDLDF